MYTVKNKVVLVTGGASGIGAEVVKVFINEGAKHVAILDLSQEAGTNLQNDLNSKNGVNRTKYYKVDVTTDDELFNIFQSVVEEHGYIDVVVNSAGIMNDSPKVYKKEIEVNIHTYHYSKTDVRVLVICFGKTTTPLLHNLGCFDGSMDVSKFEDFPEQSPQSAAKGLIEAYKKGASGSTWVVTSGKPAMDITQSITNAYEIMSQHVF